MILRALPLLLLVWLAGCSSMALDGLQTWEPTDQAVKEMQALPLESGQLLVVGTDSARDLTVNLLSQNSSPYTHAGILVIEDGQPYVYEATATIWPSFGGAPPTRHFKGKIKKEPLGKFINPYVFAEIWDLPQLDKRKIADYAVRQYQQKVAFDPYFDYQDHSALYCSEFVALALEAGGATAFKPTPNRYNPSMAKVLQWMEIAEAMVHVDQLVSGGERLLIMSRAHSLLEIRINNAVRTELRRRHSCDQKVGNLLRWSGSTLKYVPAVKQFVSNSNKLFRRDARAPSQAEVDQAIMQFADKTFGPFDSLSVPENCR